MFQKQNLKLLNSAFTIINDKKNCQSSNGNYILSCSEVDDESYENIKISLSFVCYVLLLFIAIQRQLLACLRCCQSGLYNKRTYWY